MNCILCVYNNNKVYLIFFVVVVVVKLFPLSLVQICERHIFLWVAVVFVIIVDDGDDWHWCSLYVYYLSIQREYTYEQQLEKYLQFRNVLKMHLVRLLRGIGNGLKIEP